MSHKTLLKTTHLSRQLRRAFLVALLLMPMAGHGDAAYTYPTAQDVYFACSGVLPEDQFSWEYQEGFCHGYLDAMFSYGVSQRVICPPPGTFPRKMQAYFLQFIADWRYIYPEIIELNPPFGTFDKDLSKNPANSFLLLAFTSNREFRCPATEEQP